MRQILLTAILLLPACGEGGPAEDELAEELDSKATSSIAPESTEQEPNDEPALEAVEQVAPTAGRFDVLGTVSVANHALFNAGDLRAVEVEESGPSMEEIHAPTFSLVRLRELQAMGVHEEVGQ